MGRRPVLESLEEPSKTSLSSLFIDTENLEHLSLDIRVVDSHRSAAQFDSVEHDVVGPRHGVLRIVTHLLERRRRGERMMRERDFAVLGLLEQRKVHNP